MDPLVDRFNAFGVWILVAFGTSNSTPSGSTFAMCPLKLFLPPPAC